jgi:hypothetical protein
MHINNDLQQYMDQFCTSLGVSIVAESFIMETVRLDLIVAVNIEDTGCASAVAARASHRTLKVWAPVITS